MGKIDVKSIATGIKEGFIKYSPEILTGLGIAGMFGAGIMAVKVTKTALDKIEEKKEELNKEELTVKETVSATWKCYIPPVAIGMVSASCIIFASSIHERRNAALMTAYSISEAALKEYKDAVVETIGEKKARAVQDKADENVLKKHPVTEAHIFDTGMGHQLCYDPLIDRYFYSDIEAIRKAENMVNKLMIGEFKATLNDFYDELNLQRIPLGDYFFWDPTKYLCEVSFSSQITDDGRACIVIDYTHQPMVEDPYERYGR